MALFLLNSVLIRNPNSKNSPFSHLKLSCLRWLYWWWLSYFHPNQLIPEESRVFWKLVAFSLLLEASNLAYFAVIYVLFNFKCFHKTLISSHQYLLMQVTFIFWLNLTFVSNKECKHQWKLSSIIYPTRSVNISTI